MIAQLEREVQPLLAKADQADATPLQDGLTIPAEITRRQARQPPPPCPWAERGKTRRRTVAGNLAAAG